jgi:16S rRNA processing protein RimM
MAESYISVGKLGKPHGLSGAFRFLLSEELKSKKKLPKYFIIEDRGSYLPWFIEKIEWLGFNDGFISLEEIVSVEKAKAYTKKDLLLPTKEFGLFFKKNAEGYNYLVGYRAIEEKLGEIGTVTEVTENPGQVLCVVVKEGNEVVIPLVEEFILEIKKRKKEITFNLPDGLLDV